MGEELCRNLIKWLATFEDISHPMSTVHDLTDGIALAYCLAQIAPDWFDEEWLSKIKTDVGDNWRLKVSNMKKVLKGILDYYTEVLNMDIATFNYPDVNTIAESNDIVEMSRLLQLVLGCAVNCEDKQDYIQVIMGLEEDVQHAVMNAIQELMSGRDHSSSFDGDSYKEMEIQHKRTLEQLSAVIAEKEELSQRCHELDEQLTFLREQEQGFQRENEDLREKLNRSIFSKKDSLENLVSDPEKMMQLQHQLERLKEENFLLETSRDECKIKYEQLEKEYLLLNERTEQLQSLAEESQQLKDEMDILRHNQEKVERYESTIETYKKKLGELTESKKQLKSMEEKCTKYMQDSFTLEEDLRKANAMKGQIESYKKQVLQLQVQKSEAERRADKSEFEMKKFKDKSVNLESENERVRQERDQLKENFEELRLHQMAHDFHSSPSDHEFNLPSETKKRTRQPLVGSPPDSSDDILALTDVSPEIRERLLRLTHENKRLKEQAESVDTGQHQLLQSMLNDTNERKDELERENREMNKRILELESDLEEKRNAEMREAEENEAETQKKYAEYMEKFKKASEELQRQREYIDSLEPKFTSKAEKVNELQEIISKKDKEMKSMEERYKKYLDKAKSVIKTLDPKAGQGSSSDIQTLQSQLSEKKKLIEHLERDHEKMKTTREREEKLIVSAWYEMGLQLHRKAAEERLSGSTGMSFLARQRQASSRRQPSNSSRQTSTAAS